MLRSVNSLSGRDFSFVGPLAFIAALLVLVLGLIFAKTPRQLNEAKDAIAPKHEITTVESPPPQALGK